MQETEAIETALEAYRNPQAMRSLKRAPLPHGMLTLIKLAASSPEELTKLVTEATARDLPLQQAAAFFLQQQLIDARDDYRQLALAPGAVLQDVKEHKRWLLKWLHPDRNRNSWEAALFQRVAASAERLESALREGVQPVSKPSRRHGRRIRQAASWQLAQRRVREAVGWRSRILKVAAAIAVLVLMVALAQLALVLMQGTLPPFVLSRLAAQPLQQGEA